MSEASVVSQIVHDACVRAPVMMPEDAKWWEHLTADFPFRPEPFQLKARDALQVRASAAGDVLLRTLGATLVGTTALPFGYRPSRMQAAIADQHFYGRMAETRDPTVFFRAPPSGVRVRRRRARWPRFRARRGDCWDLSFESPYVPVNPRERVDYLRHRANRIAHARLWKHGGGPRPLVMAVHGFSADLYLLNEWFFALPWLHRMGFDVCLFTLPFHGPRQTRFSPFSGHGFFAGGVNRINEAFGQAIFDLRIFLNHLEETFGVERVGITGVSLGGFTSALMAAVEPRLAFAIPNVPVVSLADLVHEWEPMGSVLRRALSSLGLELADTRRMLAVSCPLSYPPLLPRERLMVIGGVGDRLAPPKHARLLWDHWDRCRIHWFPGSHLLHFDRGNYLRQMARFLRSVGFYDGLAPPVERRRR